MPLLQEYVSAYTHYVCPMRPHTCIQRMYVPSRRQQLVTLKKFEELQATHMIPDGVEGAVFLSLVEEDAVSTELLVEMGDVYSRALETLRQMVRTYQ